MAKQLISVNQDCHCVTHDWRDHEGHPVKPALAMYKSESSQSYESRHGSQIPRKFSTNLQPSFFRN